MSSAPAAPTPEEDDDGPEGEFEAPDRRERIARAASNAGRWRIALYAVLGLLVLFYLAPLWAGIMTAFKTDAAFNRSIPFFPPLSSEAFTLGHWRAALAGLRNGLINSALLAVPATVLSATLGSFAAYGVMNMPRRRQIPITLLFVAGIFIPYQAVLVPLFRLYSIVNTQQVLADLGVWTLPFMHEHYASIINLIITHTAYGIPITFLLFRGYYQSLSEEMLEAARLDGATVFSIYRRIVLPLSVPMFAVTLIYQFTQIWNDLLFALVIIPSGSGPAAVVTMQLNNLSGGIIQSFGVQMAGAFVAALPTLLVYIAFGDRFAKGVAGS